MLGWLMNLGFAASGTETLIRPSKLIAARIMAMGSVAGVRLAFASSGFGMGVGERSDLDAAAVRGRSNVTDKRVSPASTTTGTRVITGD